MGDTTPGILTPALSSYRLALDNQRLDPFIPSFTPFTQGFFLNLPNWNSVYRSNATTGTARSRHARMSF